MSWLTELKRRHVGRVFVAYAAAAFVVLQAADVVIPALGLPEAALQFVMALVILGFPVAMAVAWAYDITPRGLERTAPEGEGPPLVEGGERREAPAAAGGMAMIAWVLLVCTAGLAAWGWLRPYPDPSGAPPETRVRRAEIQLPGLSDLRGPWSTFTVSSDGSTIAYQAFGLSGQEMMVRRLADLSARPVAGTSGGTSPFLSPDGSTLGFVRESSLYSVSVAGGSPTRLLADVEIMLAGNPAWTPDGRVVLSGAFGGLLVAQRGQVAPDTLTRPPEAVRHVAPSVLPDGRHVLFTLTPRALAGSAIATVSLESGEIRVLVDGGVMNPRYADGHLFFVRLDGSLMAAPFDPERLDLLGEPVPTGDQVSRTRFGLAHFFAAPGAIFYAPRQENRLVEWRIPEGRQVLWDEPGSWHHPRYSPDGSRLVFDNTGTAVTDRDVWTLDLENETLSRVTRVGDAHDPVWLRNGVEVSFFSFLSEGGPLKVTRADGSGTPRTVRLRGPIRASELENPGTWTLDGSAYIGGVRPGGTNGDILLFPMDGSDATPLVASEYDENSPALSPDGRWLAFSSDVTGRREIYVIPMDGSEGRLQVSNGTGSEPVWGPDGRTLFYLEPEGMRVRVMRATLDLSGTMDVLSRAVAVPALDLEESDNHTNFDVHPSGDRVVFAERQPSTGLVGIFGWRGLLPGREPGS
jgi:Tol biopolymer transport system component